VSTAHNPAARGTDRGCVAANECDVLPVRKGVDAVKVRARTGGDGWGGDIGGAASGDKGRRIGEISELAGPQSE